MRRPVGRRAVPVLVLALLTAAAPVRGQRISNSELFDKSLEAARQALEFYGEYDNPAELRRVTAIGYRLARAAGEGQMPFSFYLVDMPVPNAFALPGGHIFLTRGMLDLDLDDDMLAGLLGHEIAHVVFNHGMRMQKRATLLNVLSQALLAGVIITAKDSEPNPVPDPTYPYGRSRGGSDRVMGAAAAGVVVSELLLRSYSREFEDEADEEGQRLAAGAGFAPQGVAALMTRMRERLPENREYGYWRTHPFFDTRVRAAEVRAELFTRQPPEAAERFRIRTQAALLVHADNRKLEPEKLAVLEDAALAAWPLGPEADRIRLARLEAERDRELEDDLLGRDFGRLIRLYEAEIAKLELLATELGAAPADEESRRSYQSELPTRLEEEIATFESRIEELYPRAREVFGQGVYETEFLETFVSNYSDAPELAAVALALGQSYSRLRRPEEAVERYLEAYESAPESEAGRAARAGLKRLAPVLVELGALQRLAESSDDPELAELAAARLEQTASSFEELANGADFLRRFPDSELAPTVRSRLDKLAENLYGEVVLYQSVGDHVKALERIQKILTDAPFSPAAGRLRERAVLAG